MSQHLTPHADLSSTSRLHRRVSETTGLCQIELSDKTVVLIAHIMDRPWVVSLTTALTLLICLTLCAQAGALRYTPVISVEVREGCEPSPRGRQNPPAEAYAGSLGQRYYTSASSCRRMRCQGSSRPQDMGIRPFVRTMARTVSSMCSATRHVPHHRRGSFGFQRRSYWIWLA